MAAFEVKDPYQGKKYSDIITMNETNVKLYRENPHPLKKIAGTAKASWDATISRWVV